MNPAEGIFYVVREPTGWRLVAHRFSRGHDRNHVEMWEEDIVPGLARLWDRQLNDAVPRLARLLSVLAFAFPRGRVTKLKDKFMIYHGDDLRPFMNVSKKQIEDAFGIAGICRWVFDDHEQCVDFEKEEIRGTFQIAEDWPAAKTH